MKIPRSVKIAGHKIKVRIVKNIAEPSLKDALGYADLNHNLIVLRTMFDGQHLDESTRAEVFLHELIHMSEQIYGLQHLQEKEVRQLGAALFQIIRDNKLDFNNTEE